LPQTSTSIWTHKLLRSYLIILKTLSWQLWNSLRATDLMELMEYLVKPPRLWNDSTFLTCILKYFSRHCATQLPCFRFSLLNKLMFRFITPLVKSYLGGNGQGEVYQSDGLTGLKKLKTLCFYVGSTEILLIKL